MRWTIELTETAIRQLSQLDRPTAKRLQDFLRQRVATLDNPRLLGGPLKGPALGTYWRYRVGDWRILCELHDQRLVVLVLVVGNRREVYRS